MKLQDVQEYKGVKVANISIQSDGAAIYIEDAIAKMDFGLLHDDILKAKYFYGRLPIRWIQNDDQEGLQPRVLDQKRLFELSKHLRQHPQLAPAIARIQKSKILLFDGQYKTAAQILNGVGEIDCKVFLSQGSDVLDKKLFDQLMITNLDAHSKLRQVPFYTSTLIERFSVIYKEIWEEFTTVELPVNHSEENFKEYLVKKTNFARPQANEILRSMIIDSALGQSEIRKYVAEASKDQNFPVSQDILKKGIFPNCLYLEASRAVFDSPNDFRNNEAQNFASLALLLENRAYLRDWVAERRNANLTQEQLRARRIWHKGAVLTWGPMLKDVLINACNILTEDERGKLLYRPLLTPDQEKRIDSCLVRLFDHTLWIDSNSSIDTMLASASRQEDLFEQHALKVKYVLTGTN